MLIGELSQKSGLSRDTLRFYEKEGLIKGRAKDNGYKDYPVEVVEEIKLIHLAKTLGFSLKEIKSLKFALLKGELNQATMRKHLEAKLIWINSQIRDFKQMKKLIESRLNHCDTPICKD